MKIASHIYHLLLAITLFNVLLPSLFFGQTPVNPPSTYIWFDGMIGPTNSGVFEGVAFTEEFRVINERHQFFKEPYFVPGSVVYHGQSYFNVKLRYDVYNDQLSIQNEKLGRLPIVVLGKEKVAEFNIGQHRFKHLSLEETRGNIFGFFEVLLHKDSLTLFKKHRKKPFKRTDEEVLYYEFKDSYTYHLKYDDNFYTLDKAKDFNAIFPEYRKSLKAIRNRHTSLGKSDPDTYMKSILSDLLTLISTQSDKETL